MCEIIVRTVDKVNDDPYKDAMCTKRGDVIHVAPDGWNWGAEELNAPHYRIIKLPNVPIAEAEAFLGRELDDDPKNPSRVLRRRAFKLDLDHPALNDPERLDGPGLRQLKVRKPRLQDPKVIG